MKFFKKFWLLFIIIFLIPLLAGIIYFCCFFNADISNNIGTFIGGLIAYFGTSILGLVSMWQNIKLKEDNEKLLKKQEENAAEDKKVLLEQNRKIAFDSARFNVLPYFSISQVPYHIRTNLFSSLNKNEIEAEEKIEGYWEGLSWYFAILLNEEEIKIDNKETNEIKDLKKNVFCAKKDSKGVVVICDRTDFYLPLTIKNSGRHNAINFSFSIYKDNHTDFLFYKKINARPFLLEDELRIDIYIPNIEIENKYWLEFNYFDVLGNKYVQKDYLFIKGKDSEIPLEYNQVLEEKK